MTSSLMLYFQKVVLSHANLNKPVHLVMGTIAGYHWSDKSKATHVYTTGGIFPVTEKPEEIDEIIKNQTQGGLKDGNRESGS